MTTTMTTMTTTTTMSHEEWLIDHERRHEAEQKYLRASNRHARAAFLADKHGWLGACAAEKVARLSPGGLAGLAGWDQDMARHRAMETRCREAERRQKARVGALR